MNNKLEGGEVKMGLQEADQVKDVIVIEKGRVTQVTRHTTDGGQIKLSENSGYTVDYRDGDNDKTEEDGEENDLKSESEPKTESRATAAGNRPAR